MIMNVISQMENNFDLKDISPTIYWFGLGVSMSPPVGIRIRSRNRNLARQLFILANSLGR